jgi:bifunctional non-homologous end joining protein LigD
VTLRAGTQQLHGRDIDVSSVDRVLFPDVGLTKGELVAYYDRIAATMFPYVADRPVALKRFPRGIDAPGFFQKNAGTHFPDWIGRVRVDKRGGGSTDTVVITEPAAIVYLADQGTVELHSWLTRRDQLDRPDQLVFDLDPPGEDIEAARTATRRVGSVLDELALPHLLKTSGSKGYHVHVLVDRDTEVDVPRFAADVAGLLAARHPGELTTEIRKDARRGRVLVDHVRNRFGQTVAAPYSVRARPGAPISTPIDWRELGTTDPQRFTVRNVFRRLGQREDPWAAAWRDAAGAGTSLVEARARLDELLADVPG